MYQFGELAHLKSHLNFGRSRLGNPKLRFQMLRRFSGAECCPADVFPPWCVCAPPSQTEARETATTSLRLNIMLFYNVCCPDWGWKLPSREDLCFTKLLCKANNRPRFSSTWSTTREGGERNSPRVIRISLDRLVPIGLPGDHLRGSELLAELRAHHVQEQQVDGEVPERASSDMFFRRFNFPSALVLSRSS